MATMTHPLPVAIHTLKCCDGDGPASIMVFLVLSDDTVQLHPHRAAPYTLPADEARQTWNRLLRLGYVHVK